MADDDGSIRRPETKKRKIKKEQEGIASAITTLASAHGTALESIADEIVSTANSKGSEQLEERFNLLENKIDRMFDILKRL